MRLGRVFALGACVFAGLTARSLLLSVASIRSSFHQELAMPEGCESDDAPSAKRRRSVQSPRRWSCSVALEAPFQLEHDHILDLSLSLVHITLMIGCVELHLVALRKLSYKM